MLALLLIVRKSGSPSGIEGKMFSSRGRILPGHLTNSGVPDFLPKARTARARHALSGRLSIPHVSEGRGRIERERPPPMGQPPPPMGRPRRWAAGAAAANRGGGEGGGRSPSGRRQWRHASAGDGRRSRRGVRSEPVGDGCGRPSDGRRQAAIRGSRAAHRNAARGRPLVTSPRNARRPANPVTPAGRGTPQPHRHRLAAGLPRGVSVGRGR